MESVWNAVIDYPVVVPIGHYGVLIAMAKLTHSTVRRHANEEWRRYLAYVSTTFFILTCSLEKIHVRQM